LLRIVAVWGEGGTGSGWINSPAGAYRAQPSWTGKGKFGFVSGTKTGATAPPGKAEFRFQTDGLNFGSAADGQVSGGRVDNVRIKIWDKNNDSLVYDTVAGASEDLDKANPQALAGGSVIIHK
jgi:hypothetical protein